MPRIRMTYSTVTPESAEQGDFAEHGWAEDGGWKYPIDHDNPETLEPPDGLDCSPEPCDVDEGLSSVDLAVAELCIWYSTEPEQDYGTGESTEYGLHLVGFSEVQEAEIYSRVAG